MGSSCFRHPKMENDGKVAEGGGSLRGGRGSRRGKKTSSDKPTKQPQRGLGVAQLEKIRLHGQLGVTNFHHPSLLNPYPSSSQQDDIRAQAAAAATNSPITSSSFSYNSPTSSSLAASYGYNPHFLIANDYERAGIKYDDVQTTNCPSWIPINPSNVAEFTHHIMQPMSPTINLLNFNVEADSRQMNNKSDRGSSSSRNSEDQELDLELRLSR